MKSFIEEFYYGNIEPQELSSELGSSLKKKLNSLVKNEDEFREKLSEEETALETLSEELKTDYSEEKIKRFSSLQQQFEQNGGYEYKSRAKGTLISMGFNEEKLNLKVY